MKIIKLKTIKNQILTFVLFLFFANFVHAHNPAEHSKQSDKPNCAAIKSMNQSKTDKNDPVLMAMMIKCKKAKKSDKADYHTSEQDHHDMAKEAPDDHTHH